MLTVGLLSSYFGYTVGFEVASSQADATQKAEQAAEDYRQQNI